NEKISATDVHSGTYVAGGYKSTSRTPFGYLLGIGAELAFTDQISAAFEYDYSSVNLTANMTPASGADTNYVEPFHVHVSQQTSTIGAHLNFKVD
ncbi:MAG: hypothetical protein JOZ55_00560, partial [Alphaproteobacteria bacterium]|nr:hypothetical protein [Alphaproteobacteria bacterium]